MKRKEIADLLRSYRNDESIIWIESRGVGHECQLITVIFSDAYHLPTAATCVNMAPIYGGIDKPIQALVTFIIDIEPND